MPYTNDETGDFAKLQAAWSEIMSKFGSFDALLEACGLADMPQAHRYGIMFGFLVFFLTVTTVISLLVFGGSFKRMKEQEETGDPTLLSAAEARLRRALLLERLLEGRERMMQNYPPEPLTEEFTNLTKMLMNVAPDRMPEEVTDLVDNEEKKKEIQRYIPPFYEENYIGAYRKCQDRPGGAVLSGRPEARFESYARGYAGCGPYTSVSYRRSYGRMYESICCASLKTDDKYLELFKTRPYDIVGYHVCLEALEVKRHLKESYHLTSGEPVLGNSSFEPEEVWGFLPDGPFKNPKDMRTSFVFQRKRNEGAFAIVDSVTNSVLGVVLLTNDNPEHLTIQIEPPIMHPQSEGSKEQLEACFLLMDRLFALGYRRIQLSIDSQDANNRKLASRLGFTLEGVLIKHMVIKEASRDSSMYGMLNSDWKQGARSALFKKLYSASALKADSANERKEAELAEQEKGLKEKNLTDAAASKK